MLACLVENKETEEGNTEELLSKNFLKLTTGIELLGSEAPKFHSLYLYTQLKLL